MKNLIIRSISGVIYVGLIVASLLLYDRSSVTFNLLFVALIVVGQLELLSLHNHLHGEKPSWMLAGVDTLGGIATFATFNMAASPSLSSGTVMLPLAIYLVVRLVLQLFRPRLNALHSLGASLSSILYVALPLSLLGLIVKIASPALLLGVFVFVWLNDTGAFIVGSLLGKHRLFERVSPKKSWEGFFGGLAACVLGAWASWTWCGEWFTTPDLGAWIGLAVVTSLSATLGDLVESLLKRTAGVKDSGNVIPGHGGVLDRLDSMLLVSPCVLIFVTLLNNA